MLRTFPSQWDFVCYSQIGHVDHEDAASPSSPTEKPLCGSYQQAPLCTHQNPATSIQDKNGYAWCTANSVPRESGQDQDPGSVSQACQQLHLEWHFSAVWISMSLVGDGSEHLFMWILTNLHLLFLHGYEVSIHIAPSFLKFNFCFLLLVWRDL